MAEKFLEAAHNLTKKHWILYTIVTFLPTIWFSLILNYFGKRLYFLEEKNGKTGFTTIGLIVTILIVFISLSIAVLNNWYSSKSEFSKIEKLYNQKIFYEQLNKSVDYICKEKLDKLRQKIYNLKNMTPLLETPDIISDPSNQLKRILEQINECLCVFLRQPSMEYKHKDFFITLVYRFPLDGSKWKWLEATEEKGLSLEELFDDNSKSTFNYILKNNRPHYFNNDKANAKQHDEYIYDPTDQLNADNNQDVGSVFCCRFNVKKRNNIYVDALLSVSTYKKRFCNPIFKDEELNKELISNVEENLLTVVKEYFGKRIGIELSLLYLESLHNNSTDI